MKGVKHYTEGGEYGGPTHKMDGKVHTGAKHSETSEVVSHSPSGPFKMRTPFKCWDTHKKVGMKDSPTYGASKQVNDCEKK
jgi:hypothetical protein